MGFISNIFGDRKSGYEERTHKNSAVVNNSKDKEKTNMNSNENIKPCKKTLVWTHMLKEEKLKLSFQSDAVWQYKKENGDEDIIDKALWLERVNNTFNSVRDSVKKSNSKYCTIPTSVEIIFHHDESTSSEKENTALIDKKNKESTEGSSADSIQKKGSSVPWVDKI